MKHYLNLVTACICCLIFTIPCSAQAPAIQWQKSFGGTGHDMASDVKQTKDGGYIMVGSVSSSDGDVIGNHGAIDVWVLKMDANGKLQFLGGQIK